MKAGMELQIQTNHQAMEAENMSNLTSASAEATPSSVSSINTSLYSHHHHHHHHHHHPPQQQQPPLKKKRNLPGNPDPEAEVVALSPNSLLATNRFVCEIWNKGFQRDQNLQLHKRGHNLPWKLKQRTRKDVKKKVYVFPETTCVHHYPSITQPKQQERSREESTLCLQPCEVPVAHCYSQSSSASSPLLIQIVQICGFAGGNRSIQRETWAAVVILAAPSPSSIRDREGGGRRSVGR